jgi:hypothetical protein
MANGDQEFEDDNTLVLRMETYGAGIGRNYQIFVKTLTGKTITLDAYDDDEIQ